MVPPPSTRQGPWKPVEPCVNAWVQRCRAHLHILFCEPGSKWAKKRDLAIADRTFLIRPRSARVIHREWAGKGTQKPFVRRTQVRPRGEEEQTTRHLRRFQTWMIIGVVPQIPHNRQRKVSTCRVSLYDHVPRLEPNPFHEINLPRQDIQQSCWERIRLVIGCRSR